jgi:hypothetical protein
MIATGEELLQTHQIYDYLISCKILLFGEVKVLIASILVEQQMVELAAKLQVIMPHNFIN